MDTWVLTYDHNGGVDSEIRLAVIPTTVSATDAVPGIIELATQGEVDTGTDADRAVTPLTLQAKITDNAPITATDIAEGIIELATQAEVTTGTDATRAVTSATLQGKIDAIPASSPLTTKGDLYAFDVDNVRLPVGANDFVLTADSTAGTGVAWKAAAGGGGGVANPLTADLFTAGYNLITSNSITVTPAESIFLVGGDNSYVTGGGPYTFGQAGSIVLQPGNNSNGFAYEGEYGGHGIVELRSAGATKNVTIGSVDFSTGSQTDISLVGGSSTASGTDGGDVTIKSGDSATGSGANLYGYAGASGIYHGGHIKLIAGDANTGTPTGYKRAGNFTIGAGDSAWGPGGNVTITSGDGNSAGIYSNGGQIDIISGDGAGTGSVFGPPTITITAGSNLGGGAGGNVDITPGPGGGGTAGIVQLKGVTTLKSFTLLTLPSVTPAGGMIYVSDATGGGALTGSQCFSNGTVWIDVTTGAAVA